MQFTNSYKMKLAVILGVTHMLLGIGLKILNNIKKNNKLVLWTLAVPQLIFMLCTFFYMDFLIFYKWSSDYTGENSRLAPSIINTMIEVFAGFGGTGSVFWSRERHFEKFLVIFGYMMIPIMLFGVPLGTYLKRKK
jgi:V-type H+-transporting ATPase subunit a